SLIQITNAVFSCSVVSGLGINGNLRILSNATLFLTNQYAADKGLSTVTTNVLNLSGSNNVITINAGTINAVSSSNAAGVFISSATASAPGDSLIVTNGGKFLSEQGTFGSSSSWCTGIVAGVGSVWSN